MADLIQLRRDLAANWTAENPTLAQGEIGLELDTKRRKLGDGTTAWNSLDYDPKYFLESTNGVRLGGSSNYAQFATDGTLTLAGTATVFDDMLVEMKESLKGSVTKPDWDGTNYGFLFPQNDTSEFLIFNMQLPHKWKEGSTVFPHVHIYQNQNVTPTFAIDYRWTNIGDATPGSWTTYTMNTLAGTQTWTTGLLHRVVYGSAGISGSGKTMSSMLQIKLYRNDNTYSGDCLVTSFDIHYEIDSLGSSLEYTK